MTNPTENSGIAGQQLLAFLERIERLEAEKADLASDIKEVYAEAKGTGFDTGIIRKLVALRKKDSARRQEEQELLSLYMQAVGLE
jgi:uncharacterized protein (UPF0335 family)